MIGYAQGDRKIRPLVAGALRELGATPAVLPSTLGRTLSRGLETLLMARYSLDLLDALEANVRGGDLSIFAGGKWEPSSWPAHAQGAGFVEAPRGGLSHWVVISDQRIDNYQAVVPSTWNASPRDARRSARRLRSSAGGHAGGRSHAAVGGAARPAFLRPVHGLRGPPARRQRPVTCRGACAMTSHGGDPYGYPGAPAPRRRSLVRRRSRSAQQFPQFQASQFQAPFSPHDSRRASSRQAQPRVGGAVAPQPRRAGTVPPETRRAGSPSAAGQADSASHGQPGQPELVTVKVWQLPTRLIHWGLAISILVLSVTGFYIGNPQWFPLGTVTMTGVKAVHYGTGLVLIALLIARVIWMFSGNRYERLDQFVPFHRSRRDLIGPSIKYYGFLRREPPPTVGHNPLAGLTYLLLLSMLAVESVTGLALKSLESGRGSLLWTFFHWVFAITSISTVRFVHHLIMWLTLGFVIHHVYSAILVDREERSGLLSSMVTGYKTVPKERL